MRGEVITVDGLTGDGSISGEDGARYSFAAASSRVSLMTGDRVDFVPLDGVATEIMVMTSSVRPAVSPSIGRAPVRPYDAAYNFGWAMFAFDGRLRRSHFWISWAILFGVGIVTNFIPFFGTLISLALLWPHIAIGVKRFHDMGRSGWWITAPWGVWIVAFIGMFMTIGISGFTNPEVFDSEDPATMFGVMGPAIVFMLLAWLVSLGFWLWLGIADSQPGRNKYGRNPKHPYDDDAAVFS
jgi:uncharacterized membrane protein YhaH (DUF805 family)